MMKDIHNTAKPQTVVSDPEHESSVWPLPHVEDTKPKDEDKTNAFGYSTQWRYEPPESNEEEEPVPLTAEEIEEIRQAAHDEGFNQGKEEGFSNGYEEGKQSGHEEGLKLGHEEGVATGLAEGEATINELSENWQAIIAQLHQPLADVEKNVEEQLLNLVVALTKAVTQQEVVLNVDILMSAISTGIKALPSQEAQTQILLHPSDIERVEIQFGSEHIQEQGWRLLPAPQLSVGSCQIENSTSTIDLSINSRLKEVLDPFLQDALHQ